MKQVKCGVFAAINCDSMDFSLLRRSLTFTLRYQVCIPYELETPEQVSNANNSGSFVLVFVCVSVVYQLASQIAFYLGYTTPSTVLGLGWLGFGSVCIVCSECRFTSRVAQSIGNSRQFLLKEPHGPSSKRSLISYSH